jgi:hypothetical protein
MDQGYSSPSAKIVTAGSRLYGLVEGELFTSYDMAAKVKPCKHIFGPHLKDNLKINEKFAGEVLAKVTRGDLVESLH